MKTKIEIPNIDRECYLLTGGKVEDVESYFEDLEKKKLVEYSCQQLREIIQRLTQRVRDNELATKCWKAIIKYSWTVMFFPCQVGKWADRAWVVQKYNPKTAKWDVIAEGRSAEVAVFNAIGKVEKDAKEWGRQGL